jgi:riboflavin kinase/FMN adenylyltransferase
VPFTLDLASLSPEAFVQEVLGQQLAARRVAVGENFRFGTKRSGDCHDLVRLGERHGIAVEVVPMLWDQSKRISSSRIRQALSMADLKEARRLLDRPYRFRGRVVMGRGLGRQLGWPTANLQVDGRKFLPLEGVYAALAWRVGVAEGPMAAVMNLGPQPTVDPTAPSAVEVHLLDRQLDLVEASLVVEPISLLRRQERFADLAALTSQIARDAQQARQIFAAASAGRIGVGESPTDEQGDGSEQQDA